VLQTTEVGQRSKEEDGKQTAYILNATATSIGEVKKKIRVTRGVGMKNGLLSSESKDGKVPAISELDCHRERAP